MVCLDTMWTNSLVIRSTKRPQELLNLNEQLRAPLTAEPGTAAPEELASWREDGTPFPWADLK